MKKSLILGVLGLLFFTLWYYVRNPLTTKVSIRGETFYADVAVTVPEREKGLSGRLSLPQNRGMLFIFDHPDYNGFWMKDMHFPLDFIWIDGKAIADITPNVPVPAPGEKLAVLQPKSPADKVLEVNAGTIDRLGIQIGDVVIIKN